MIGLQTHFKHQEEFRCTWMAENLLWVLFGKLPELAWSLVLSYRQQRALLWIGIAHRFLLSSRASPLCVCSDLGKSLRTPWASKPGRKPVWALSPASQFAATLGLLYGLKGCHSQADPFLPLNVLQVSNTSHYQSNRISLRKQQMLRLQMWKAGCVFCVIFKDICLHDRGKEDAVPFLLPSFQAAVVCMKRMKHPLNLQPIKATLVANDPLADPNWGNSAATKNKDIVSVNGVKRKNRATAGEDTYGDLMIEELYKQNKMVFRSVVMLWPSFLRATRRAAKTTAA